MSASTVNDRTQATGADRGAALVRRIAELDSAQTPGEARLDALGLGLVDALLAADVDALQTALDALREVRAGALAAANERLLGWLAAAISCCHWGIERLAPDSSPAIGDGTHARSFIQALGDSDQLGSAELRELLDVDETEVSRTGRRMLEAGLVTRAKIGRNVFWSLTPRGRQLAGRPSKSRSRAKRARREPRPGGVGAEFWMEAIRQGFEGAAGDEPATGRRTVDPTRERIVVTTLGLHTAQGILETSYDQIAKEAGVSVATLESYFPTREDLVKGCGQHILNNLQLPPPDRVGEVFSGADSGQDRLRRLIATLFDAYERESEGLERGRRDRATVPLVAEAIEQVEVSIDALVAEALKPIDPDAETLASVRALTDLEVWRALRETGASPDESVDEASSALERWVDSQAASRAAATP